MTMVKRAGSSQAVSRSSRSGGSTSVSSRSGGSISQVGTSLYVSSGPISPGREYSAPAPAKPVNVAQVKRYVPPAPVVVKTVPPPAPKPGIDVQKFPTAPGGALAEKGITHVSLGTKPTEAQKAPLAGPAPGVIPWYVKQAQEKGNQALLDRYAYESIVSEQYYAKQEGRQPTYTTALYEQLYKQDATGTTGMERLNSAINTAAIKNNSQTIATAAAQQAAKPELSLITDWNPLPQSLRPGPTVPTSGIMKPGVKVPAGVDVNQTSLIADLKARYREVNKQFQQATDSGVRQVLNSLMVTLDKQIRQAPAVPVVTPAPAKAETPRTRAPATLIPSLISRAVQYLAPGIQARVSAKGGSGWRGQ